MQKCSENLIKLEVDALFKNITAVQGRVVLQCVPIGGQAAFRELRNPKQLEMYKVTCTGDILV